MLGDLPGEAEEITEANRTTGDCEDYTNARVPCFFNCGSHIAARECELSARIARIISSGRLERYFDSLARFEVMQLVEPDSLEAGDDFLKILPHHLRCVGI